MFQLKSTCCLENRRESLSYLMCNCFVPASNSSYFGKGRFPVLQTTGPSAPDCTNLPLGGSEAALLHPGSLLQCKHHQLEGTGQSNKVFTTHSQSKKYREYLLHWNSSDSKKASSFTATVPLYTSDTKANIRKKHAGELS